MYVIIDSVSIDYNRIDNHTYLAIRKSVDVNAGKFNYYNSFICTRVCTSRKIKEYYKIVFKRRI